MAATDPERVRVLVVTDWDAGFALMARPPLPDVAPGDAYVTKFVPQGPVTFREILVVGFVLVQITSILGGRVPLETRLIDAAIETGGEQRLYRLDKPIIVGTEAAESLRLFLCNASDVPRKQKSVALVKDAADWPAPRQRDDTANFLDKFLRREVTAEEISDYIDAWHSSASHLSLHAYLGMTAEEYAAWVSDASSLERIRRTTEPA